MSTLATMPTWLIPAVVMAFGAVIWAFGARVARPSVSILGFTAGVPAGVTLRDALGLESVPPVVAAMVGAFIGLVLARTAYRLMLATTVGVSVALLAAVLSGSLVDTGVVAKPGEESVQAAKARAQHLAETVQQELESAESGAPPIETLRAAGTRFWRTLDGPERTLVLAATLASGAAGFCFGLFLRSLSEIGVTAIVGAMSVSWGLSQMLAPGGPSTTTWCLATAVLAVAGMVVQTMRSDKPEPATEPSSDAQTQA